MQRKFNMEHLFYLGLPILLLGFLLRQMLKQKNVKVANVQEQFRQAMDKAFQNSKYKSLKDYWIAVSKMETGGWTSYLFLTHNNPWGMKAPKQRRNAVASATDNGWAVYDSLEDAARDIILWMDARRFPQTVDSLDTFIANMKAKGYFEEPLDHYLKLVKAWIAR